jgi:hypothetical protein
VHTVFISPLALGVVEPSQRVMLWVLVVERSNEGSR